MDGRLATGVVAVILSLATVAAGQARDSQFHDCYRVTRATYAIDAAQDGVSMRLAAGAERLYPARAARFGKSARVSLECQVVADRPLRCAVTGESPPGFGFGSAAVRLAEAGRLSGPAGVWPIDVVVSFRRTPLAHPLVAYC
jgi:hypothetical protein